MGSGTKNTTSNRFEKGFMTEKTNEELIEEFLANGGEIEVIPPVEYDNTQTIGSTTKKVPKIMTLPEGEFMFGRKQTRKSMCV